MSGFCLVKCCHRTQPLSCTDSGLLQYMTSIVLLRNCVRSPPGRTNFYFPGELEDLFFGGKSFFFFLFIWHLPPKGLSPFFSTIDPGFFWRLRLEITAEAAEGERKEGVYCSL